MALQNKKSLGQHWLKDRGILDEIAEETLIFTEDPEEKQPLCVEIGPGLGTLTSSLLRNFPKVLAIEFDQKLATNLPKSFPGKNLEVVNADILKYDFSDIKEDYVVAGNIPYYITSPIIMKLIELENKPKKIALLIQKEVAERVCASEGKHTYLSLSVQNRADVLYGIDVPREYFTPPPKVDSATIILEPLEKPQVSDDVIRLIKLSFASPRKKLIKNLMNISDIQTLGYDKLHQIFETLEINENSRPADLSLEMWAKLYDELVK